MEQILEALRRLAALLVGSAPFKDPGSGLVSYQPRMCPRITDFVKGTRASLGAGTPSLTRLPTCPTCFRLIASITVPPAGEVRPRVEMASLLVLLVPSSFLQVSRRNKVYATYDA